VKLLRYFAVTAAAATGLVLAALSVLVAAVTLIESAGDFAKTEAGFLTALMLSAYGIVQHGYQVLPIACFLGALVSGTLLAQRGEILGAQAGGVSTSRLASAFLLVAVVAAGLGAACGEVLVPRAITGVERVQQEELRHSSSLTRFYSRRTQWYREGALTLHLPAIDEERQAFRSPEVYRVVDGHLSEVIEAEFLRHDKTGWWLENATVHRVDDAAVESRPVVRLELRVGPEALFDVTGDPRQMTSVEIARLIARRQEAGLDATAHRIELHSRLSLPLSALWMFLLVAPWALHPERRRSMAVTLGGGVLVIAVLLALTQVFRLLALGHEIPAWLGSWGVGLVTLLLLPISFRLYRRYRVRGSVL
jgi:lipopolysaccharide export system permease protein